MLYPERGIHATIARERDGVTNTMLLHDFAYVPVGAGQVRDRLLANRGEWLSPLASAAASDGEELRLRIGPSEALPVLSKTVRVTVGDPLERGEVTVVPITWQATGTPGCSPSSAPTSRSPRSTAELTQLTLHGRYEPPLGAIGRRLDRLLMHRVAEASVRSFLRHLAEALTPTGGRTTAGSRLTR